MDYLTEPVSFSEAIGVYWKVNRNLITIGISNPVFSQMETSFSGYANNPFFYRVNRAKEIATEKGIERPNSFAESQAIDILNYLNNKKIAVDFVNPSNDGGLILEIYLGSDYYLIEVYNDKDIVFLSRKSGGQKIYDTNSENIFSLVDRFITQDGLKMF